MKRILFLLTILLAVGSAHAQLPAVADFRIDAGNAFQNLDALEGMLVADGRKLTAEELHQLTAMLPDSLLDYEPFRDPLFKLNAFNFAAVVSCVGSCISVGPAAGIAAVLVVHSNTEPPQRAVEVKRAWLGCVAGNAPYVVFVGAYIAAIILLNQQEF